MTKTNPESNQNNAEVFAFESSQKDFYQLLSLFESGELSELLGMEIVDVGAISESQFETKKANLNQWLQRVFNHSWKTLEELLKTPESSTAFAFMSRSGSTSDSNVTSSNQERLLEIDPQQPDAVTALVNLLDSEEDEEIRLSVIECLAKVSPGNIEAIQALIQLLRTSNNQRILQQAALSLGQIGEGNDNEVDALRQLIQTSQNNKTRWQAALSLGKIAPTHPDGAVRRAKELGLQLADSSVVLIVYVRREAEGENLVLVQVCPPSNQVVLPPNLRLAILDESEEIIMDEFSGNEDKYLQLSFTGEIGDLFNIKVALGNDSIIENFQI